MLWLALTLGAAGVLFGFWLIRVHFIIAESVALALLCVIAAPIAQWTPLVTVGHMLALMAALQGGYLAGVILFGASARAKPAEPNQPERHQPMIPG
jgi:hypothetical protein